MTQSTRTSLLSEDAIFDVQCQLAESPVWDASTGRLYWVDINARRLFWASEDDGCVGHADLPIVVSAIALRRGGGFVAATQDGFAHLDLDGDRAVLTRPSRVAGLTSGWRMNDGACDRQGRFWSGAMRHWPNERLEGGALHCFDADGVTHHGGQFLTQNGLAWSPDGRVMYVSDSHVTAPRVIRYRFDPERGTLRDGALFADHQVLHGRPDGAAMDVDGCYWIAASDSGKVLRLTPSGGVDAEIRVPVPHPTNICFGGRDLKTIFITTMCRDGAGGWIYALNSPYQGLPETPFFI